MFLSEVYSIAVLHHVVWYKLIDVSEVCMTSTFRVEYKGVTFLQMRDEPEDGHHLHRHAMTA